MSRTMATPKASSDLLSVSFNQDGSCVSIGTRKGYSIANAEPFGKVYSREDGPCSIVEMLFCTSLVALVGTADSQPSSSPRKLKIVNTKVRSWPPFPSRHVTLTPRLSYLFNVTATIDHL